MTARPRVVVLGLMTKIPVAGVVWQTAHYVEGLRRLGCEVSYVEAHARTPSMLMASPDDDGSLAAAALVERFAHRLGIDRRWAYWGLHDDRAPLYGMEREALRHLLGHADAVVNLHGGTHPELVTEAAGRLVYIETDPVQLQVELHDGVAETVEFLDAHEAFFTFGELWGRPSCRLPITDRYEFWPTRQPVIVDWWDQPGPARRVVTTVANWRQPWREVCIDGETYTWTKDERFAAVEDLPRRVPAQLELALSHCPEAHQQRLRSKGWGVVDAATISTDPFVYRRYVAGSAAEFTVAKDQNVRLRSGWFSDRSATYLAAGRPVVTESTGFEDVLPTGEGLFPYRDLDGAAAALDRIRFDPERAGAAARALARDYFSHDVVLRPLLQRIGLDPTRPNRRRSTVPTRRRPLQLADSVGAALLGDGLPSLLPTEFPTRPLGTVIVVTWNHLALTRWCLESVLDDPEARDLQIVVVDNGSEDGTPDYLQRLASQSSQVEPVIGASNQGFASGVNRGLRRARGEHVILLNNDTVVSPGWWRRLIAHLADPEVDMVGPVTNSAPDRSRIEVDYVDDHGYRDAAASRARSHRGLRLEVDRLTMFCVAARRSTFEAVGPLDEGYGLGMFEDDDYCRRVREAGGRLAIAEDVLVHHHGEGSFGDLVPTGDHASIFVANRARYEARWGSPWTPHVRRTDEAYLRLRTRMRRLVEERTPPGATVAVVSRGDDDMCRFQDRAGRHFPQRTDGSYAGHHPADDREAIDLVEESRLAGTRYLVVPRTSRWWLDHYSGLCGHLRAHCDTVVDDPDVGVIFALEAP